MRAESTATEHVHGGNPLGRVAYGGEHVSLDGAGAPAPGESSCLELPQPHSRNGQSVLQECAPADHDTRPMVRMEHGSCPKAPSWVSPDHVVWRFLPPDRPERKAIERLGQAGKDPRAWGLAAQLAA
jgi:hypothetical protein